MSVILRRSDSEREMLLAGIKNKGKQMKTIIMAGGKGTRISSIASDIPKPMIRMNGKPVLEHEIECLRDQGFTDIILTVSHLAEYIMDYFGDGSGVSPSTGQPFGVHITYYVEEQPLGNAGAVFKLWKSGMLDEDFMLLIADAMFHIDFNRFVRFHFEHHALATLFTHPNSHPYDSGLVIADESSHIVTDWLNKEDERPAFYKNRVNAGLHILSPAILKRSAIEPDMVGALRRVDLDRDVLKPQIASGAICAYDSPEYVKDMGTPERFYQVTADVKSGLVAARNLKNPQKAIFLDRDGTINPYVGFLTKTEQFELGEGVAGAVKRINASGYLCIVITNQPVIARGEVTEAELEVIHNKMETLLGNEGAYVDAIYYCPHHPDRGFEGERSELKIDCECRKPKPGLLLRAAKDFHIDLEKSWMIGDGERDVKAGINAKCRTILLRGGESGEMDFGQDRTAGSLAEAVDYVLHL